MDAKQCIESGKAVLGIEFGSTRIKAVLVNELNVPIAQGSYEWENQLVDGLWTYSKEVISSKTYNTVGDIDTVAVGAVLLANDDVSEDDVYKIISGIYENMDAITKAHSKGAELNLITASSVKSVPYHKGAAKYYSEKGITVPTK